MEKLEEFNPETQSVEDWLETFEARAGCLNITNWDKKIKWCKSVIGSVGRRILKNLDNNATWNDAKQELRRFLGEEDSRSLAWRKIKQYKAKGKSLGEIASDVIGLSIQAATETDVRQRLALETFLEAIPWKFALEIKKKKLNSVEEALKEVRLLQTLDDEEKKRHKSENFAIQEKSKEERFVERRRPDYHRNEFTCWACGKKGHTLRNCRKFQAFQRQQEKDAEEDGNQASGTSGNSQSRTQLN